MTTEEVIKQIQLLVERNNMNCAIAVQSNTENRVSVCLRGNEREVGGCIISMLGGGRIGPNNLATLGAYCIAESKGLKGFGDAQKFTDYLVGCAEMYKQHSSMIKPDTRGMS